MTITSTSSPVTSIGATTNTLRIQCRDTACLYNEKHTFPVYPSTVIKIESRHYTTISLSQDNEINPEGVFFDGHNIVVPESNSPLIELIVSRYNGTIVATNQMEQHKFATLAINAGVNNSLIGLGDAIFGLDGSAEEMLELALSDPRLAVQKWKTLYQNKLQTHF